MRRVDEEDGQFYLASSFVDNYVISLGARGIKGGDVGWRRGVIRKAEGTGRWHGRRGRRGELLDSAKGSLSGEKIFERMIATTGVW